MDALRLYPNSFLEESDGATVCKATETNALIEHVLTTFSTTGLISWSVSAEGLMGEAFAGGGSAGFIGQMRKKKQKLDSRSARRTEARGRAVGAPHGACHAR